MPARPRLVCVDCVGGSTRGAKRGGHGRNEVREVKRGVVGVHSHAHERAATNVGGEIGAGPPRPGRVLVEEARSRVRHDHPLGGHPLRRRRCEVEVVERRHDSRGHQDPVRCGIPSAEVRRLPDGDGVVDAKV